MGTTNALGFAAAVKDGTIDLTGALMWHLQSNHFPPVSLNFLAGCLEAIEAGEDEDWSRAIALPEGALYKGKAEAASAAAWVESFHLDAFITGDEEEDA